MPSGSCTPPGVCQRGRTVHAQPPVQVGVTPADFSCYRRAERMPDGATCPAAGRATVLADDANGAAEVAGEAAAALAAAAALLQGGADAPLAADALATAKALFAYAQTQPQRAAEWSTQVQNTYPATASAPHRLWAAAMLAWVSRCDEATLVTCDAAASADYLAAAELLWAETKARACCVAAAPAKPAKSCTFRTA